MFISNLLDQVSDYIVQFGTNSKQKLWYHQIQVNISREFPIVQLCKSDLCMHNWST